MSVINVGTPGRDTNGLFVGFFHDNSIMRYWVVADSTVCLAFRSGGLWIWNMSAGLC